MVVGGENPSFDYYFAPRFGLHPSPPVRRFDLFAFPEQIAEAVAPGTFLIFCRYLNRNWLKAVRAGRNRLAGIGLFVDDDIVAMVMAPELAWLYRLKIFYRALGPSWAIRPHLNRVWVSTPYLAERWKAMSPVVMPPLADVMDLSTEPISTGHTVIGLHAGGSHRADKIWFEPVVRGVLAAAPNVTFEIVAENASDWTWRGDPRVRVIPFQSWPRYRADTAGLGRDLLLAPFRPTAVNAARAEVKRIDAARCGAALLVADPNVYQVSAEEAALGMVVPVDVASWTTAILTLADDRPRRAALVKLNREKLIAVRRATGPLFVRREDSPAGGWSLA